MKPPSEALAWLVALGVATFIFGVSGRLASASVLCIPTLLSLWRLLCTRMRRPSPSRPQHTLEEEDGEDDFILDDEEQSAELPWGKFVSKLISHALILIGAGGTLLQVDAGVPPGQSAPFLCISIACLLYTSPSPRDS